MKPILEAFFTGLLNIERLRQSEIGVVDGGVRQQKGHGNDWRERVKLPHPDEDQSHSGCHHEGVHWNPIRSSLRIRTKRQRNAYGLKVKYLARISLTPLANTRMNGITF